MAETDREFLSKVCSDLEKRFPGLSAAFERFVTGYLGGQRDGFRIIEVFNVIPEQLEQVWSVAQELVGESKCSDGSSVMFHLWDAAETATYFRDDVEAIEKSRVRWAFGNAPGEYTSLRLGHAVWAGQVSSYATAIAKAA